jgi:aryl-alcohol dehydrogenase-like predicted oxidoreductase
MELRQLGPTGIEVGVIGLGTWRTFDVPLSDAEAVGARADVVSAALDAGMNLFDSSPMYGTAEDVLSRALGERRSDVLIATKVWSRSVDRGKEQIAHALGLYRCIDIYQVHNLAEWQTFLPLLHELKEEGKIRAVGVTHYAHSAFSEIMRLVESGRVDCIQIPYNAADRSAAQDLLPLARAAGVGVIVMSPLGTGDLVRASPPAPDLERLAPFGVATWAQALLKWIVSDERVTTTIPATTRPERAREDAAAGVLPLLPEEERERVAWLADRLVR